MMKNVDSVDERFKHVAKSKTFNRILDLFDLRKKKVLDLGCSYGEYLVKFGKGSLGITSTMGEVEYGRARNIPIIKGNVEFIDTLQLDGGFEGMWANNLFEHLLSPHSFLIKLRTLAQSDALLVLGVPVVPQIALLMHVNKFRGALATPHINFFTRETLKRTVERGGWKVESVRPFVFDNKFLDTCFSFFAPHLYIVAHNDANFSYPEKKIHEWQDEPYYKDLLKMGSKNLY